MPLYTLISINNIKRGKKGEKKASKKTPQLVFGGNFEDF